MGEYLDKGDPKFQEYYRLRAKAIAGKKANGTLRPGEEIIGIRSNRDTPVEYTNMVTGESTIQGKPVREWDSISSGD